MKTVLLLIGKTAAKWLSDGLADYVERLTHFTAFETVTIPDLKNNRNMDTNQQKQAEGESILKFIQKSDTVFLLDDKGQEMTSENLAAWLERQLSQSSSKRLVFIIGGPYGFSPAVYAAVKNRISLSKMTFSHQMVRLIFVEQLYRAFTIINGLPYHHS